MSSSFVARFFLSVCLLTLAGLGASGVESGTAAAGVQSTGLPRGTGDANINEPGGTDVAAVSYQKDTERNAGVGVTETALPAASGTVPETETKNTLFLSPESVLLTNDIIAYYGHPKSKSMGILGRMPKEDLVARLDKQAAEYAAESGGRGIKKAFYIIYGTCWPEGNIGILSDKTAKEYIDFAAERDMLVFLDHQIGKYDPIESLKKMLPFLKYPNVHLALDPEWRTTKPMEEIGSVTAAEINRAQKIMEDYIVENNISGERLLVIHQFNHIMIRNRKDVKADFKHVRLVLCMDGHGTPEKKRGTYAFNAEATNIPVKAFKLFYNEKGNTGIDAPLLTPKEVYGLSPRPMLIMYQ